MIPGYDRVIYDTLIAEAVRQFKNAIKTKNVPRYTKRRGSFSAPVNATGKLLASVRVNMTDTEIQILCAGYVRELIFGLKPGQLDNSTSVNDIDNWINAKGLELSAAGVLHSLLRNGSSIWQANKGQNSGLFAEINLTQAIANTRQMLAMSHITEIKSQLQQFQLS